MASDKQPDSTAKPASPGGRIYLLFFAGLVLLAVLFVVGIVPHLNRNHKLASDIKEASESQPNIAVMTPLPALNADLSLPGTTEAIEDAVVGARTTGYVRKFYVDIGARVHKGQVLADIESPDVDQQLYQANAQTAQSLSAVQQAKATVSNSKATVTQYEATVRQAEANEEQAKALVADAEAKLAQLEAAEGVAESQLQAAQQQVDIQKAGLKQAQTTRDLAKVTYDRYNSLLKDGYVALEDVDQNKAAYDNAVSAVNSAQANLDAAIANARAAQHNVTSSQATVRSGQAEVTAAEKNVRAVAATVHAAQSTVTAAQANVHMNESNVKANENAALANQANSRHYAVLTSFEKVVAPFDGVITARNIDTGTLVSGGSGTGGSSSPPTSSATSQGNVATIGSAATSSGTPNTAPGGGLFGIARPEILRIFVSMPETYVRQIHAGLPAQVAITEFPGRLFSGTIARVSGALDVTSRTLLTEVHVDNRKGTLLPGMYAQVHFSLPRAQGALRVPASAVVYDSQGTRVVVVTPDNKIHYVPVKIGRDYGQVLEIVNGLTGKEALVINPTDDLTEGQAVKPVSTEPPSYMNIGSAPNSPPGSSPSAPKPGK